MPRRGRPCLRTGSRRAHRPPPTALPSASRTPILGALRMVHFLRFSLAVALTGFVVAGSAVLAADAPKPDAAAKPAEKVSYYKQIRPILQDRCQGCHQPAKRQGGLSITSFTEMQAGAESKDPLVTAGKPADSLLVTQIEAHGTEKPAMPKGADPLKPFEVELIKK